MLEELNERLKKARVINALRSRHVEVLHIDNIHYCNKCHEETGQIVMLRILSRESNLFNCVYCAKIKKMESC